MNEATFVERREPDWRRLTQLCDRIEVTPKSLSPDELHELAKLYRAASGDLALVRTKTSNEPLTIFLNDLVARAYGLLYREKRNSVGTAIADGVRYAADTVRRRKWFVLISFVLTFGTSFFYFFLLTVRPDLDSVVIPAQMRPVFDKWKQGDLPERDASESMVAWGMYASNNPKVAVIAGSIAASTFGIGTVALLIQNGGILGSLAYEMNTVGKLPYLLVRIFPHGVPELSGIIVSGAAGLTMGWALIAPGRRKRGEALMEAGRDAIVLLTTSVFLMFIAAPIEGFFSFNDRIPEGIKLAVIIVELVAWAAFWIGYGRKDDEEVRQMRPRSA